MTVTAPVPQTGPAALKHRTNVELLSADDLAALRRAFSAVYAIADDRGFGYQAGIHGLPLPISCQHHTPLFLYWHRAYLYLFELALQDQVTGVTLPWWDWTSSASQHSGVPAAYAVANSPDGTPNPLASGPITGIPPEQWKEEEAAGDVGRGPLPAATFRQPGDPESLPTDQDVEVALEAPTIDDFSSQVENLHDGVHVWVGGTMSEIPVAAFDPLFWAHHCMIDRLWYLWQLRHPGAAPSPQVQRMALPPFPITVAQTLEVTLLGYDYAAGAVTLTEAGA